MRPSNQKSLLSILYKNIEEVDLASAEYLDDKINKLDALVRASRMATDMVADERKRARLEMDIETYNKTFKQVHLREIESKGFDDTTHIKENYDL